MQDRQRKRKNRHMFKVILLTIILIFIILIVFFNVEEEDKEVLASGTNTINFSGVIVEVKENEIILEDGLTIVINEETWINENIDKQFVEGNYVEGYTEDDVVTSEKLEARDIYTNIIGFIDEGLEMDMFRGKVEQIKGTTATILINGDEWIRGVAESVTIDISEYPDISKNDNVVIYYTHINTDVTPVFVETMNIEIE